MTIRDLKKRLEEFPEDTEILFDEGMELDLEKMLFIFHEKGKWYFTDERGIIHTRRYVIMTKGEKDEHQDF